jgi:phosphatidylglycerol---prolipoprotein diacylglyceryl transferase
MHPILFKLFGFPIYAYGVLVATGVSLGVLWACKRSSARNIDPAHVVELATWVVLLGFIGARLLYIGYFPQDFLAHPAKLIFQRGGFVWYGGLIAGSLTALWYFRRHHLSSLRFGDILMPPVALGLAIGRIGCFMTGCCYGKPTTSLFGVQFPPTHASFPLHVHPTQLYETAALCLWLLLVQQIEKRFSGPGISLAAFLLGYGLIRFCIEAYRGDGVFWGPLTASQWISGLSIFIASLILWQQNKKGAIATRITTTM